MREIEGIKFYTVLELLKKIQITAYNLRKYIKEGCMMAAKVGASFLISYNEPMRFLIDPEGESQ